MKRWQSPGALKRVKQEVEAGAAQLAGALETVIVAPAGQPRDFGHLQEAVGMFQPVAGTLKLLQLTQLALLANEIQLLLKDTLQSAATLERQDIDLRLESAFVAATDLPALLEYALVQGGDSFELVFRLLNRLRKARGCAVIFSATVLQKSEDVNFSKLFAEQPERMQALVTKQSGLLQKTAATLVQSPDDPRTIQNIAVVLDNLELVSRDHKSGVIWGLARGLAEVHAAGQYDRAALAACLQNLEGHAQSLLSGSATASSAGDESGLERLVAMVAATSAVKGRAGIARFWYHLDSGFAREHRADYRDIQVAYWSKTALTKCLVLAGEDCRSLLDVINDLAEAPSVSRDRVRELYHAIRKSGDVLRMLGLLHLNELIDTSLPEVPGEDLEAALRQAAALLHRINGEIDSKLARMEREVVGSVNALGRWEKINASQARLLQNVVVILESVVAAVGGEPDAAAEPQPSDAVVEPGGLHNAAQRLGVLADVLGSVQLDELSRQLAVGRDWLEWSLEQASAAPYAEQAAILVQLLVSCLSRLEQLLYGQESPAEPAPDEGPALAQALAAFLLAQRTAAMPVTGTQLMVVAVTPATNDEVNETESAQHPSEPATSSEPASSQTPDPEPVPAFEPQDDMDESLIAVFLEEADELLQTMDALYLRWSAAPADKTCVDEYLRALHTIKGSAALVGERSLSRLAHDYETFIIAARQGKSGFDPGFFAACDARLYSLHEICARYSRDAGGHIVRAVTQPEPALPQEPAAVANPVADQDAQPSYTEDATGPLAAVTDMATVPVSAPVLAPQLSAPVPGVPVVAAAAVADSVPVPAEAQAPDELIRVSGKLLETLLNDADEISFARSRVETSINEVSSLLQDLDATLSRFKVCVAALDDQAGRHAATNAPLPSRGAAAGSNDEFDALELDRYTVLQELAVSLAENVNDLQDVRGNLGARVKEIGQVLAGQQRLANSLQDGLILTQMVPFASVVPRLKRLVRQIGSTLGKPVQLEVENRQGSVDRSILQAIITPLEHLVRNAIDHGIEAPELRRQLGKPDVATLRIAVARRGASVRMEIRDDGQGVDVEKVRQRAVRSGLLDESTAISEQEAYRLLFQSGFSTAASLSSISGRGVGLDVVQSEIAQIGGSVGIESVRGAGTAFILNLPLTSSLNRALVFVLQDTRYVVLMNTLDGVIVDRLAGIHRKQQEGQARYEYGGRHYQYLYLGKLISEDLKPRLESIDSSVSLLLVSSAAGNYALHIDAIVESRDLVVKTLGQQFASMPGIAGGVILPDGNVAIVLDLKAMIGRSGEDKLAVEPPMTLTAQGNGDRLRKLVLVVDDSVTVRKASSAMLKRNGMDVISAKNGVEAVELLGSSVPDLILLDIEMPQMDGFEVASWVRAQDAPIRNIPIIMITSRIGDKHRSRAEAIGVNEYLCKPFKEDSLLASINGY